MMLVNMKKDKRKSYRAFWFKHEWSDEPNPKLENFTIETHTHIAKIPIHFSRFISVEINESIDWMGGKMNGGFSVYITRTDYLK